MARRRMFPRVEVEHEKLVPLKGFPGVVWERSRRKKRPHFGGLL